ncbi:hypothetical protein SERLADRAFT_437032 [Serpula lacrymans var. lacrymans S7.9]|uniref:Helitron helicase-like domain-containing protein n=1 Tax=Serpula lacrymans var. lacrymans (strain S7.9) TaxID=578457 RepID=F8NUV7_SERL9|nr:uncharacterized protein SERLADRAFT_437032 [Serpula lacrymans var. lacrymans S7.9]EGO25272.1 hypothetical protein SERLADRAFT_437032 [Serpula lacrymans var. lacrymans S7.9]
MTGDFKRTLPLPIQHDSIGAEVVEHALGFTDLICLWQKNPTAKPSNSYQKRALLLLNKLKLVAKDVRGSTGYKLCQRNEIRSLIKRFGTPALFLMINPSDVHSPLVGILGRMLPEHWHTKSAYERSLFVAKNPATAATFFFFHAMMSNFFGLVIKHGQQKPGLFGHSQAYYGMVEAQGQGTLHCHLLLWLHGNPNPQLLRDRMVNDECYKERIICWMESIIHCELPNSTGIVIDSQDRPLKKPSLPPHQLDPRIAEGPSLGVDDNGFLEQFQQFVQELAVHCNWHEHTDTCWKHLQKDEPRDDQHCRMRLNGTTRALTEVDPETQSILLCRLHSRINDFNDNIIFLLKCNMDIKYIGSGQAAKALVYYITDYITKSSLPVHIGFDALKHTIQQNSMKFPSNCQALTNETNQSLFTKCVNAIMARQELSHQQVMSYLIGGGNHYKSHSYRLLQWTQFDRFIHAELSVPDEDRASSNNSDVESSVDCVESEVAGMEHTNTQDDVLVSVEPTRVSVHSDLQDYQWRSREHPFDSLSLWEYTESAHKFYLASENARLAKVQPTGHAEAPIDGMPTQLPTC